MRCPKCAGLIIDNYDDRFCLNCGWRPVQIVAEPILFNPNRSWTPGVCEICQQSAMRNKPYCLGCYKREKLIQAFGPGLASGSGA